MYLLQVTWSDKNDMVQISGKISVESMNFGDNSREIGRMTGNDQMQLCNEQHG